MLRIDGAADLLAAEITAEQTKNAGTIAKHLIRRLIGKAAQGSVMRDDICLPAAIVE